MVMSDPHPSDSGSIPDSDNQTIYTPAASTAVPADSIAGSDVRHHVPSAGHTYIIRALSRENDNTLTLLDGNVVLAPTNTRGCIYWECIESDGWLGFRNCSSNKFIGYGWDARLVCDKEEKDGHRQITITPMPKGGYVMQMLDWWTLRPIILCPQNGLQKLGRKGNKLSEGVVWEFLPVEPRRGHS